MMRKVPFCRSLRSFAGGRGHVAGPCVKLSSAHFLIQEGHDLATWDAIPRCERTRRSPNGLVELVS